MDSEAGVTCGAIVIDPRASTGLVYLLEKTMLSNFQLRKYLAKEILGKDIGRKPPGKARRETPERNEPYKQWIRKQPSLISNQSPCDACHTGSDGGMSQKSSDDTCVPLTRAEHQEYHRIGKAAFERKHGLDLASEVERLNAEYRETRERKRA